jgi:hypothetical protein
MKDKLGLGVRFDSHTKTHAIGLDVDLGVQGVGFRLRA